MGSDHFLNLQPGTIVNGRYEIVKCLGTGSMGMVYACRHRELAGHIVAMKVLFAEVARDDVAAARFRNEIVASYGVSHPNVVRAYEYFRDGDLIAFTMEFIGGGDLADKMAGNTEIPIEEIVSMLCQTASGVQAIHDAGIVHRDLKPENILITTQGNIKITDFGIARVGTGTKLTEHGGVVGTIDYVSPEYLERGQVDARSDIYALGVLVYEMITGEPPFRGKSVIETMTMRLRSDPEPPHHLRLDCPVALSNIVLKAMARNPEERYQTAREMAEDAEALRLSLKNGQGKSVFTPSPDKVVTLEDDEELLIMAEGAPRSRRRTKKKHPDTVETEVDPIDAQSLTSTVPWDDDDELDDDYGHERSATEKINKTIAEQFDPEGSAEDEYYTEPLESVLGRDGFLVDDLWQSEEEATSSQSIPVSKPSLSTDRIRELSQDLYNPGNTALRTIFLYILILCLGFSAGLWLFVRIYPETTDPLEVIQP